MSKGITGWSWVDFKLETYVAMIELCFQDIDITEEDREVMLSTFLEQALDKAIYSVMSGKGFPVLPVMPADGDAPT